MTATTPELRNVRLDCDGALAELTLDKPERRNALSLELMQELTAVLRSVSQLPEIRAIVIGHNGPAFSAGHDLGEMVGADVAFTQQLFAVCTELMQTVHEVPQPVIAKVNGIATAAGCQLVATCDLAIAAEGSRFATPGVRIGLFCSTPMVALSRAVGRKRALEMLLTGDPIDAHTAADWGLINRVVPVEGLDQSVRELVDKLADSSPLTMGIGKEAFYKQIDLEEPNAYDLTRNVMVMNALARDAQEGMGAFLEKRPPVWTGK